MSGAPTPPVIPQPWATNADPSNITIPPNTGATGGRADYDVGFPPVTMQPVGAGGIPPFGQDFNGILFALSAHDYYVQAGQLFKYSAIVAGFLGGYARGTILGSADGFTMWCSLADANMDNPDTTSNNSWVAVESYGYSGYTASNANITIDPRGAATGVIIVSGTLSANVSLIFPPMLRTWLLVNNTTGPFTLTARLASSVGVNVPQGGFANPLGIYGGAPNNATVPSTATEIYPTVTPLGVPISQSAVPLTLVERDNTGGVNAAGFVSTAGPAGAPVNYFWTDAGDGVQCRSVLAFVEASMNLAAIGGQVTAGQVPSSAVTQYAALILASAALTGVPTAPTAGAGTANTQVATTAFVNPGSSLVGNGYRRNPDGSIDQWGSVSSNANAGNVGISFNIPFPSQCFVVEVTIVAPGGLGGAGSYQAFVLAAPGTTSFTWRTTSSSAPGITIMWRAIGK